MKILLFPLALIIQLDLFSQMISLDHALSNNKPEFSGLARLGDQILLIPTCKGLNSEAQYIYSIDSLEIEKCLSDSTRLCALNPIKFEENSVRRYLSGIQKYDGFEAAVVIEKDSLIFLSVETKGISGNHDPYCYILKGKITSTDSGLEIKFIGKKQIRKYCGYDSIIKKDGGFESLTFINNMLVAYFEWGCNSIIYGYSIDTSFTTNPQPITGPGLLNNRLTDITTMKQGPTEFLIGINSTYEYDTTKNRYDIVMIVSDSISSIYEISKERVDFNWEGIIPFKDGVLLINDNAQGNSVTKSYLKYIPF